MKWQIDAERLEITSGRVGIIIEKIPTEQLGWEISNSLKANVVQVRTLYTHPDELPKVTDDSPNIVMTPNPPNQMPHSDEVYILRNMRDVKCLWLSDRVRFEISCGEYVTVIEQADQGKRKVEIFRPPDVPPRLKLCATLRWKCPENEEHIPTTKVEAGVET